ncbi:hypothetical protein [Spirosoma sordidisoli]|uniref:Uncharacterized protein n=1 Tax=Spirosoma sordidisoli TaxID=2502893 RepID=A0A4Q2UFV6_9BACT|nr:hypothetical protein [Spirosoma sordidisoli]RYC66245.1 hypothetical protein EQG79_30545 [Spirosoma sordidisoli]
MAKKIINWATLVNDITENCVKYHDQHYKEVGFTGPSLHFHIRALELKNPEKIEFVYAALTAWGMHRMGKKGAKLNNFDIFEKSIKDCEPIFTKLGDAKLENSSGLEFDYIKELFHTLNPMASGVKIVGVSKVLAHYIPDIIAPVDRQYTFQFLNQKKDTTPPRNWDEYELLREIHLKLFKPIALNEHFRKHALEWLNQKSEYPWDTSIPKIIDNLIIGKLKGIGWVDESTEA